MKYTLTGDEIIDIIAKHASKNYPDLKFADGSPATVTLCYRNSEFWVEIEVNE